MTRKNCAYLLAVAWLAASSPAAAAEADLLSVCGAGCRDSALSSLLLAAGMYSGMDSAGQGVDISLSRSQNLLAGTLFGQGQTDAQDITLSYDGSSGRLGFSAGYLYTDAEESWSSGTALFGWDSLHSSEYLGNTEKPWYVTFNLSRSFQVGDDLAFGVGSRTMLLSSPLDDKEVEGRAMCMSLNLPVSYGGFLTVTPEVQWSRPLLGELAAASGGGKDAASADNAFYGGMSITLSY